MIWKEGCFQVKGNKNKIIFHGQNIWSPVLQTSLCLSAAITEICWIQRSNLKHEEGEPTGLQGHFHNEKFMSHFLPIKMFNYPVIQQPCTLTFPIQNCSQGWAKSPARERGWDFVVSLNHIRLSLLFLPACISSPCWQRLLRVNPLVDSAKNHLADGHPGKFATHTTIGH